MAAKFYLITGGCGFIGAALAVALVQAGHKVRILDNQSRGALRRLSTIADDYEMVEGDVRDPEVVVRAVKGTDSVCHLAFINGTESFYAMPEVVLDVGVKGMVNVLDACIKENIAELVLASSSEVYQTPRQIPTAEDVPLVIPDVFNPRYSYAAGKIISEVMAVNYGRKFFERVMIFRPHNVYGPDMGWQHVIPHFIVRMKELAAKTTGVVEFPIQGSGKQTRAFVFIDDFIKGLMLMLEFGKHLEIYNIGSGEEVTIKKIAQLVGKYFGRRLTLIACADAVGGTARRCPNLGKLKQLGYRNSITLAQGIELTAPWYENNWHLVPEEVRTSLARIQRETRT